MLSQWELHDLLLHEHSRTQRTDRGRGATSRFAGIRHSPAALPADIGSPAVAFEKPDLGALHGAGAALAQLMETRASLRDLGPLDAARLGDFLYRTARVRAVIPGGDAPGAYDQLDRPHPSAGGMHELTTYIAVGECPPLEPGIYRDDGVGHGLDLVAPAGPDLDRLLRDAASASLGTSAPPLVLILAAEFTRLSWKYEGIAYALMLKNVGVLFLSMQLVATAMGLGSCPLGGGDSELFARAIGPTGCSTPPSASSSSGPESGLRRSSRPALTGCLRGTLEGCDIRTPPASFPDRARDHARDTAALCHARATADGAVGRGRRVAAVDPRAGRRR